MWFYRWVSMKPRFRLWVNLTKPMMSVEWVIMNHILWLWVNRIKPMEMVAGEPYKTHGNGWG